MTEMKKLIKHLYDSSYFLEKHERELSTKNFLEISSEEYEEYIDWLTVKLCAIKALKKETEKKRPL